MNVKFVHNPVGTGNRLVYVFYFKFCCFFCIHFHTIAITVTCTVLTKKGNY
jgi:hypothetical protein